MDTEQVCDPAIPQEDTRPSLGMARWVRLTTSLLSLLTILVAVIALRRFSMQGQWSQLGTNIRAAHFPELALSASFTLISFIALGAYDVLGCRVAVPGRIRITTAMFAGAVGNSISNTLGFHAVTGTAVRLRIYRRSGILAGDVLRVVSLSWLGIGLGFASLISMAGLFGSHVKSHIHGPDLATSFGLGALIVLFLLWLPKSGRALRWGTARVELPKRADAFAFIATGVLENGAAIAALYVLIPAQSAPAFMAFAFSYACAVAVGVASQVPGGLGVFEATLIAVWGTRIGPDLVAALAVYRVVYNFVPFLIATIWLGVWELMAARADRRALSWSAGSDGSAPAVQSEAVRAA